jgi:hypothetical protein
MPNRPTSAAARPVLVSVFVPGLCAVLAATGVLASGAPSAAALAPSSVGVAGSVVGGSVVGASSVVAGSAVSGSAGVPGSASAARVAPVGAAAAATIVRTRVEAPSGSAGRAVPATQQVTVKAPASARTGSRVTLTGTVSPVRSGLLVRVQRRYGGSWHTVATTRLTAKGTWAATTRTPSGRAWLRYRAAVSRNGDLPARTVEARKVDNYTRHTYVVVKRGTITVSMKDFAAQAAQTYGDARGWRAGHHRFARVSKGGDFTLVMSEARFLPTYSSVCSVKYSCRAGRYVVINQNRWRSGSKPFTGTLRNYRHMVVNHETGHWLGRHHAYCGGKGKLAPVMQQQSKGMQGCKPNAWPLPTEIDALS